MNVYISKLAKNRAAVSIIFGAAAFSAELIISKLIEKKRNATKKDPDPQMNIFEVIEDTFEYEETYAEQLKQDNTVQEEPHIKHINVFSASQDWDYELELSTRSEEEPYVIHADEFIGDEMNFRQETVTYYSGDDIMANQNDTPIYNYQGLMGELKFGHGSKDPNVVYIRNEKTRQEWEVLRHSGRYEFEVLGNELEDTDQKHSVLKFRDN